MSKHGNWIWESNFNTATPIARAFAGMRIPLRVGGGLTGACAFFLYNGLIK